MTQLPESIFRFLNDNAQNTGTEPPDQETDLFKSGVLDSFALVDFVTLLEEECGVKVPDSEVKPSNFRNIAAIETYVADHTASKP
jgi:acyl carrier protein